MAARVVAVLSGKGGTGKTLLASALGSSLVSDFKKRALLADCNFTSPGLGVTLNIVKPAATLYSVLNEGQPILQAVYRHDNGLDILPASLSIGKDADPGRLPAAVAQAAPNYDFIILDCAGTISPAELAAAAAADTILIVTNPDLPAVTGAMKLIGTLQSSGRQVEGIVLNRVASGKHALSQDEIETSTRARVLASVPEDQAAPQSLSARTPMTLYSPQSPASLAIRNLAADLCGAPHFESPGLFAGLFGGGKKDKPRQLSPHLESLRDSVVSPPSSEAGPPFSRQPPAAPASAQPAPRIQQPNWAAPAPAQAPAQPASAQPDAQKAKDDYMKQWMDGKITLEQMMEKIKELEKGK